ncbi:hypothetical protein L484_017759 [Morus notabilis]|uniref:Uncharacterized protein n=1 Tax=Morus notabilis TaxID=981085 RepID=W9R358_9ROSA|nr:hypothetical protein L484_017759 [Morus notabilis]
MQQRTGGDLLRKRSWTAPARDVPRAMSRCLKRGERVYSDKEFEFQGWGPPLCLWKNCQSRAWAFVDVDMCT